MREKPRIRPHICYPGTREQCNWLILLVDSLVTRMVGPPRPTTWVNRINQSIKSLPSFLLLLTYDLSYSLAMPEQELRLLALDGGGVRGLSSLQILKQLMDVVDPESPPKPYDYFDMIGGTSTGGFVGSAVR